MDRVASQPPQPTTAPAGPVSVGDFFRAARRRWWWLLALTLLSGVLAVLLSTRLTPKYEGKLIAMPRGGADRSSLLNSLAGQFGGIAALAGLNAGENSERAEAVQMLQSRLLAREFIEEKNLLPLIFAGDWDDKRHAWRGRPHTLNEGVLVFDGSIRRVMEDRRTGLITVRILWRNPAQAAAWANELVKRANERLRQRAVARAQKSLDYLRHEATNADTVEVRQALYRLMEEQYKNMLLANVSEEYSFAVIDPAVPADPNQYVSPNHALFALVGLFFGGFVSIVLVFAAASRRSF